MSTTQERMKGNIDDMAGRAHQATDTAAPYSFSWDASGLSGSQSLTAKAYDTGSHVTTSGAIGVTVVTTSAP